MSLSATQLALLAIVRLQVIQFANECPLYPRTNYTTCCTPNLNTQYDFIIVGGGSAGSVLANRLSEIPQWKILLIEAGDVPSNLTEIPGLFLLNQGTEHDWQFKSEPGNYCQGLEEGRCNFPQGKALGGTSSINAMIAIIGTDRDYNRWEEMGNTGWNWVNMQPYFVKIHNKLKMTKTTGISPPFNLIADSVQNFPENSNSPWLGFKYINTTIYQNQRFSAAKGYIVSARNRSNLCILTNTNVTKILFNYSKTKAIGVQLATGQNVYCKNEVIISAGAINSPKLLLLSGIGPAQDLQNLNISCVRNLSSVGKDLHDHLVFIGTFVGLPLDISMNATQNLIDYCASRTGPLVGTLDYTGFINTLNGTYPDFQYHVLVLPKANEADYSLALALKNFGFNNESIASLIDHNENKTLILMAGTLSDPKSRGYLKLQSKNPQIYPKIWPNYLSDAEDEDMNTVLRGIEYIKKMIAEPPFANLNATLVNFSIPNCNNLTFDTEPYWRCSMRNFGTTVYHQVGTCKMGTNSSDSVVDPSFRVHGIQNLRVIDSSTMPRIVSCNTNIPTMAMAERAAFLLKNYYNCSN